MFNGSENVLFHSPLYGSFRDEAIELADRALAMTKEERIKEFSDLLKEVQGQTKTSKNNSMKISLINFNFLAARRRKSTVDEEDDGDTKTNVQESSILSEEILPIEKSIRKPIALTENGEDEQVSKKKRQRKTKEEPSDDITTSPPPEKKIRRKASSSTNERSSSSKRKSKITNGNESEHPHASSSSSNRIDPSIPASIIHLLQASNPPLSNYEQKQIADGILHHPNEKNLTFDEAQTYAKNKAMEISKIQPGITNISLLFLYLQLKQIIIID